MIGKSGLVFGRTAALAYLAAVAGCAAVGDWADNWTNFGNDGREQHFSAADGIDARNVASLKLAWHFDLEPGFIVSAPVAASGKLFVTTGHSRVRVFESATGKLLVRIRCEDPENRHEPRSHELGPQGPGLGRRPGVHHDHG